MPGVAKKSLEPDPRNGDLRNLAGICAATLGKNAQAETFLRQAMAVNPVSVPTHFNLGIFGSSAVPNRLPLGEQPNGKLIESAR